jgi:DNA polymerase III subunit gamma/tau
MTEPQPGTARRVLARAYRPGRLSEVIGQEGLVRSLTNALTTGRIAHAYLLTGIRGVGKTTTARLIARALNCIGEDGKGGPTPEPCGVCMHCVAIAEDRHMDVLEMDAATRTGIDDIREIVDSVRYAPSMGRFKVYIVDEVHMLSERAFNGLLKTLEEPPPHGVFVLATTEVRKLPVTVLSRCQRYDLRRIEPEVLVPHLGRIAAREDLAPEPEALALIVRAAEGSVRDALSLLDQAVALAGPAPTAADVREMLGLAERGRLLALLDACLRGAAAETLGGLRELYDLGAEPEAVIHDLLELTHGLSRIKLVEDAVVALGLAGDDADRARDMAARLSLPVLARAWQMLLRGVEEVRLAPQPLAAAEMLLLRLACTGDMPPPSELARLLREGGPAESAPPPASAPAPSPAGTDAPRAASFEAAVALCLDNDAPLLGAWLREGVHLVAFEPGHMRLRLRAGVPPDLPTRVASALSGWTGRPWLVEAVDEEGAPTLAEQEAGMQRRRLDEARDHPTVKSLLDSFPGATIVDIGPREDLG